MLCLIRAESNRLIAKTLALRFLPLPAARRKALSRLRSRRRIRKPRQY